MNTIPYIHPQEFIKSTSEWVLFTNGTVVCRAKTDDTVEQTMEWAKDCISKVEIVPGTNSADFHTFTNETEDQVLVAFPSYPQLIGSSKIIQLLQAGLDARQRLGMDVEELKVIETSK